MDLHVDGEKDETRGCGKGTQDGEPPNCTSLPQLRGHFKFPFLSCVLASQVLR